MDKKKILIVSRSFYPENSPRSFRTTELAKEFARQGHQVSIILPERTFDMETFKSSYPNISIKEFGPLKFKPVILKGNGLLRLIRKIIQRTGALLFEYPDIQLLFQLPKVLIKGSGFDLLISIAAPHPVHWGVSRAIKKNPDLTKIWVADCGDPYMGVTLETFRKPFYFKYFEKDFCRRADFITVPTEGATDAYYPEFRKKIKIIPQGFDFSETLKENNGINNEVPTFAYAGSLATKGVRCPFLVLEYLKTVKQDFRFHIFSGAVNGILSGYKPSFGGKLIVHEKLDRLLLLNELKKMDFLVNFDNGTSKQLPSKLIDYALTQRPILNIYPLNPDYTLFDQFLKQDYSRQYYVNNLERYNIKNVVSEFIQLAKK